jgi:ATP-dependent Clp protease ATP-binding subunit ClpC
MTAGRAVGYKHTWTGAMITASTTTVLTALIALAVLVALVAAIPVLRRRNDGAARSGAAGGGGAGEGLARPGAGAAGDDAARAEEETAGARAPSAGGAADTRLGADEPSGDRAPPAAGAADTRPGADEPSDGPAPSAGEAADSQAAADETADKTADDPARSPGDAADGRPAADDTPPASADPAAIAADLRTRAAAIHEAAADRSVEALATMPAFRDAVDRLVADDGLSADALLRIATDGDEVVSSIGIAALVERRALPGDWPDIAIRRLRKSSVIDEHFLLLSLVEAPGRVIGRVLAQHDRLTDSGIAWFLDRRVAAGEPVDAETFAKVGDHHAQELADVLTDEPDVPPSIREAFAAWRRSIGETESRQFLRRIGKVWDAPYDTPPASLVAGREERVARITDALGASPRGSVVLIGEHGVGKTALLRAALDRLPARPLVFEASASEINAGMTYVGELEGRVREIAEKLRDTEAVWVLPRLDEALWAGQHNRSPQGLLDALMPYLENGDVVIAAEVSPAAWQLLVKSRPRIASLLSAVRVPVLGGAAAQAVCADALRRSGVGVHASGEVLAEAGELAEQFLPSIAPPGALLALVGQAAEEARDGGRTEVDSADVLRVLSRASRLPLTMLDPDAPLATDAVRAFLSERVIGQPEAVDCLVERVALVKAGLTDPTRPLGVFLFVGPTGTGKTELAKTLAEYMFGSASRLIRLDMSEFQTADSLERLLSDAGTQQQAASLISSVRADPFAVVLLDEFEKAATPIWDVFLQVFDDGRLTDLQGATVDFRRCVFILTSNVGSAIVRGSALGFERRADQPFSPDRIERVVQQSFRPEFLNRIDRVVVFRPFAREQMRALLEKELRQVEDRRGLRGRPWAIEYDESALTLLVDRGFSPELGARPLKRAVERYLLAPLAQVIVEHTAPTGEQFLFVTGRAGRIDVEFVDPDAADDGPAAEPAETVRAVAAVGRARRGGRDVRSLALNPRADATAAADLLDRLAEITEAIEGPGVSARKEEALAALGRPGFWDDDARFGVLATANYLDRLGEALRTAQRLGGRLRRARGGSAGLVGMLALRLHVLEEALAGIAADATDEVYLALHPITGAPADLALPFQDQLVAMYVRWGERRGMAVEHLGLDVRRGPEAVLIAGGLGAATILAPEAGLHVLELPVGGRQHERALERVGVMVAVAPRAPDGGEPASAETARAALAEVEARTAVVRRYRFEPTPLVRDGVRGFRTGRLDRVLGGDFDLF